MKMKSIWVLLVSVVIINSTDAKSLKDAVLEKDIIESDVSKASNLSTYAMTRRRNISLFPNRSDRKRDFVVNLNPRMKTVRQSFKLEKYRKPFMKKLLIKDINNKYNVKETAEDTTRRSLMQRKNYTVRPQDLYEKSIHKKYNWNNRNTSTYNSEISKSETNIVKRRLQPSPEEKGLEEEAQNFNTGDMSINDHDFVDFEKQHGNNTTNTNEDVGLRKSKTLLLFPKRNISNYSKNILRLRSENETSSNKLNDQHSNVKIIEDKNNGTITPEVIIKSDVKEVNQRVVSNAKRDVSGNSPMTNDQRFRFYTFMKHKS